MAGSFLGILLPSSLLTLGITRWMAANHKRLGVQAFKAGLVPVTLALLVSTAYVLTTANAKSNDWPFWLLSAGAALIVWRTKIHLLWLLGAGAVVGAMLA
jgi:chromate transporter